MAKIVEALMCENCKKITLPKIYDNGYCQKCGTRLFYKINEKEIIPTHLADHILAKRIDFFGTHYKKIRKI